MITVLTQNIEIFKKFIGCKDCQQQWAIYCPLCKKAGNKWKGNDGKSLGKRLTVINPDSNNPKFILKPKEKPVKKITIRKRALKNQPLPITYKNFFISTKGYFEEIGNLPEGYKSFFKSKGSEYFIDDKKEYLIRTSNHWGFGIAECDWHLKGYGFLHCGKWQKKHSKSIKIGIIRFDELQANIKLQIVGKLIC